MTEETHGGLSLKAVRDQVFNWGLGREYNGSSFDMTINDEQIIITERKRD